MKTFSHVFRIIQITHVLLKHGLLLPYQWKTPHSQKGVARGKKIRETLEELGPIFVKFGQLLSMRFDILPEEITKELVLLQDRVPPFASKVAQQMIENSLGSPLHQIFKQFDLTPLASASIAQVHSAILLDGKTVVVKVLRPNVHKMIKQDIELLKTLAKMTMRFWKKSRTFKPYEIIRELERTLTDELDLMREAANASQLKRNFLYSPLLHVPEIHWQFTTRNILVMEQVYGISVLDINTLKHQGFNLKQLAENAIEIFFTQVFRDSFFHADWHPGNIFICRESPKNPKYIAVDFGIMGSLSPTDQAYLAENILAFLNRDYREVAILHLESGWVPKTVRIDEFESAIRTVCEPLLERPLKEISLAQLLFRLFQIASQFKINIQPQLILLQKTLMNIEGLSRHLDPNIDFFTTAKPFLEKWMKKKMGVASIIQQLKKQGPAWLEKLTEIPNLMRILRRSYE
ncbi:MAG TPA: 2-polyprenylphenol 6-hydroxylase [Gammaproteobacteria bacterium]|nr:2-polyprenylphenol 6-hydroxylase [Gammaproteobacteria bacterium]